MKRSAAWRRFDAALRTVLSVSKEELDRRLALDAAHRVLTQRRRGPAPGTPPPHMRTGGGRRTNKKAEE